MKNFKKILGIFLVVTLVTLLCGCQEEKGYFEFESALNTINYNDYNAFDNAFFASSDDIVSGDSFDILGINKTYENQILIGDSEISDDHTVNGVRIYNKKLYFAIDNNDIEIVKDGPTPQDNTYTTSIYEYDTISKTSRNILTDYSILQWNFYKNYIIYTNIEHDKNDYLVNNNIKIADIESGKIEILTTIDNNYYDLNNFTIIDNKLRYSVYKDSVYTVYDYNFNTKEIKTVLSFENLVTYGNDGSFNYTENYILVNFINTNNKLYIFNVETKKITELSLPKNIYTIIAGNNKAYAVSFANNSGEPNKVFEINLELEECNLIYSSNNEFINFYVVADDLFYLEEYISPASGIFGEIFGNNYYIYKFTPNGKELFANIN